MSNARLNIDRYAPQALIGRTVTGRLKLTDYKGTIEEVRGQKGRRVYTVDCEERVIIVRPYRPCHTIELASK